VEKIALSTSVQYDEKLRNKGAECGKQRDAEKQRAQELETQMRHLQLLLQNDRLVGCLTRWRDAVEAEVKVLQPLLQDRDREVQVSGLSGEMDGSSGCSGKVPGASFARLGQGDRDRG